MEKFIKGKEKVTEKNIRDVAEKFLNGTIIKTKKSTYRICEVEFYLRSKKHKDEYTHCNDDQLKYGKWYFHKFKNGSYKGGTFKGVDLTLGEKGKYCGVLIRSIYDIDNEEMVTGPSNVVTRLLADSEKDHIKNFFDDFGEDDKKILTARKSKKNRFFYVKNKKLDKEDIFMGPRVGLNDTKYPDWRKKNYRFVTKKKLVKRDKRTLVSFDS